MSDESTQYHFDPATYLELVTSDIPDFAELQERTAAATADISARRVLDLGTGTGETAMRLFARHVDAELVGVDESEAMLALARERLPHADFRLARLEEDLPEGPFDVVTAALAIHHLDATGKRDLFRRLYLVVRPGGRFVLTDVVIPDDPKDATIPIDGVHDQPSSVADQIAWLEEAGFSARLEWSRNDLAIVLADRP